VARPVRLYAGLEAGLGLWAGLTAFWFPALDPVSSPGLRLALAVVFLLPPTLAMGATFPLMGRLTIAGDGDTGSATSAFYGANTLGAAAGALLGPLVLMPNLGLSLSLGAAAALDLGAAGLALRWLRGGAANPRGAEAGGALPLLDPILIATFLVGACGMGLEVVLSRLLVTVTGSSVYAYAIVLAVFLAGIGLGSRQLVSRGANARTLGRAALLLPALTLGGLGLLRWQLGERDLFGALQNRMPTGVGALRLWASHALFAALALLPPALALGMALPSAAAAFAQRWAGAARENALARVYTGNTAGALLGSLGAGFVLLPRLGPEGALGVLLAAAWLGGLVVLPRARPWALGTLVAAGLLGSWLHPSGEHSPWLFLGSDAHATVSVEEERSGAAPVRSLRVNGKVVATTAPVDLRLQRLLGQIPGLLHGRVRRALVIGLGTGMTAGSLLDFEGLERLDIFEISPRVVEAARWFAPWNGEVLDDGRTHLAEADGRHALATSVRRWDLITSDPIHPWTRGSSDLYSVEHFRQMAAHLAPGGVASQWLPLYQLSTTDVRTVIASWCAAFPHTSAWLTAYDLALVGSVEPLGEGLEGGPRAFRGDLARHLAEAGVHSPTELAALEVAGGADLAAFAGAVPPMHDDRPVLEFRAPFSYLGGYATEVLAWAGRGQGLGRLPAASRPRARQVRALLATFLEELPEGLSRAARRYGDALLSLPKLPGPPPGGPPSGGD